MRSGTHAASASTAARSTRGPHPPRRHAHGRGRGGRRHHGDRQDDGRRAEVSRAVPSVRLDVFGPEDSAFAETAFGEAEARRFTRVPEPLPDAFGAWWYER